MKADDSATGHAEGVCEALLLDNQLCFALYSTSLMLTKVYKPLLQALEVTYPQYLALMVLWERDGITVGDISTRLLTDPGSLTPLLKRLEADGIIDRIRSKADERVVQLFLTEKGRGLQKLAESIPECILATSGSTVQKMQAMQRDLIEFRDHLQASL
jgi:DNA-binding MarR family transcriptional regulator